MAEPDIPVEHDAVFLWLLEPLNERVAMPPLAASHVPRGLVWESFGYAAVRGRRGMVIRGTVDRSLDDETIPRDVELRCDSPDPPSSYKGFSGAPLIVDGAIRGIIQERLDGGIGAISLARLRSYLEAVSVKFRAIDDQGYLPPGLARELEKSIPNWRTLRRLEEVLADQPEGYVVLSGHPGSGKTLISAGFKPADDRMFVVGRYFAGGHGGSELPPAYYRHLATFAQWLSAEAAFKSGQAEGVGPDTTTAEFARSIAKNLEVICSTVADDRL